MFGILKMEGFTLSVCMGLCMLCVPKGQKEAE